MMILLCCPSEDIYYDVTLRSDVGNGRLCGGIENETILMYCYMLHCHSIPSSLSLISNFAFENYCSETGIVL